MDFGTRGKVYRISGAGFKRKLTQCWMLIQYFKFMYTNFSNHIPSFQPLEKPPPSSVIGAWRPPTQAWH